MTFLRTLWAPGAYHGTGRKRDFFEGWYYKNATADGSRTLVVIPGISLPADRTKAHAFVMVAEPGMSRPRYFRFPASAFRAEPGRFEVAIGPNRFSENAIELDLSDDTGSVRGGLSLAGLHPWPVRLLSPGAMGWYAFVPTMECFHAVLSFDHRLGGSIVIDGAERAFNGGRGYLEKDWGISMPASWIWLQSNHFDEDGVSLFGSMAKIPWKRRFFTGFIFGLLLRGRIRRWATYTGAKISHLRLDDEQVRIAVEGRDGSLEIEARRASGIELPAPAFGDMTAKVSESLGSHVRVRFEPGGPDPSGEGRFTGTGRNAGLELVGDIDELVKGLDSHD